MMCIMYINRTSLKAQANILGLTSVGDTVGFYEAYERRQRLFSHGSMPNEVHHNERQKHPKSLRTLTFVGDTVGGGGGGSGFGQSSCMPS